jgi:hypothetical protein
MDLDEPGPVPFGVGLAGRAQQGETGSLPTETKSMGGLRPRAEADRDAELDEVLREIGNELLEPDVPERLLRIVRAAAAAADEAGLTEGGARDPTDRKRPRTRRE